MIIYNKNYNLRGVDANIVHISDIHYYNKDNIKNLNKVLFNISKIKPEYTCITGDLTDESNIYDEDLLIEWLIKLSNISKVILSIGNHELYIDRYLGMYGLNNNLFTKIKNIKNLYLLDNDNKKIGNINFIGLTLPIKYYKKEDNKPNMEEYFKSLKIDKNYYNVLLCHSPMNICNEELLKNKNINLLLCGHMHGGMVPRIFRPIFRTKGIITPNKKISLITCYGHIKIYNTDIIITSGITVVSHMNKFKIFKNLYDSEIVNIKIKK